MQAELCVHEMVSCINKAFHLYKQNALSPFLRACMLGHKHKLRFIIKQQEQLMPDQSPYGADELCRALYIAVARGSPTIVSMLLQMDGFNEVIAIHKAIQMSKVSSNYDCHEVLLNYLPASFFKLYTHPLMPHNGLIPREKVNDCRRFFMQCNLHPVNVALNLVKFGLFDLRKKLIKALDFQTRVEMCKGYNIQELIAIKSYYYVLILTDLERCRSSAITDRHNKNADNMIQEYVRRVYEGTSNGQDYADHIVTKLLDSFPFRDSNLLIQIKLNVTKQKNLLPLLWIFRNTLVGGNLTMKHDAVLCSCCKNMGVKITCLHCNCQYCSNTCESLHKLMHVKICEGSQQ